MFKLLVVLFLGAMLMTDADAASPCVSIHKSDPNAPSGIYKQFVSNRPVEFYCEMGLNGGAYTFLAPQALTAIKGTDLLQWFTNRTAFLLRARKTDGTQPYAVLKQLPEYGNIPLKLGLSESIGYNPPVNRAALGLPFLYFGFLPIANATNKKLQGLMVNGVRNTFVNCDSNPNSQITLFPNFREVPPSTYYVPGIFCNNIFSNLKLNPSGRVMPPEMFMFGETHWGGCGCYQQTNQMTGILGFNIGFK